MIYKKKLIKFEEGEPNGIEQVFDNLTVKHMDALRRQIQSLVDNVLKHSFWTNAILSKFWQ